MHNNITATIIEYYISSSLYLNVLVIIIYNNNVPIPVLYILLHIIYIRVVQFSIYKYCAKKKMIYIFN